MTDAEIQANGESHEPGNTSTKRTSSGDVQILMLQEMLILVLHALKTLWGSLLDNNSIDNSVELPPKTNIWELPAQSCSKNISAPELRNIQ